MAGAQKAREPKEGHGPVLQEQIKNEKEMWRE